MICAVKYNFAILELIGQPYFDLTQANSKNVWNKCFNQAYLESIHGAQMLRDNPYNISPLTMQHCLHSELLDMV